MPTIHAASGLARRPRATLRTALLTALLTAATAAQPPLFRRTGAFLPPEATGSMEFGDLDGDGDEDLLSVPGGVFLNDGFGAFVPAWNPSSAFAATNETGLLSLSDVDGDGAKDAWVAAWGQPVVLWMNGGAGDFYATSGRFVLPISTVPGAPSAWLAWEAAAAGDLDGDGDQDLVLAPSVIPFGSQYLRSPAPPIVLNNAGSGLFSLAVQPVSTALATSRMVLADWDGDGDPDLLAVRHRWLSGATPGAGIPSMPVLKLLLNDGTGSFSPGPWSDPAVAASTEILIREVRLNGDTLPDLWLHGTDGTALDLFFPNQGNGILWPPLAPSPPFGSATLASAAVDLDGDGRTEFVRATAGGITVHATSPWGWPLAITSVLPGECANPTVAHAPDLDRDGDRDLVIDRSSLPMVFLNDGAGGLVTAPSTVLPVALSHAVQDDVDGDGDADAFGRSGSEFRYALNDGAGRFPVSGLSAGLVPDPPITSSSASCLFDLDQDDDLDVYVALTTASPDSVWRNGGPGPWTPAGSFGGSGSTRSVLAGDLDGDGRDDLVLGRTGTGTPIPGAASSLVLRNLGGALAAPLALPGPPRVVNKVALVDIDGDADPDIVEACSSVTGAPGANRYYSNLGGLGFSMVWIDSLPAQSVTSGDFDADGDQDLVFDEYILLNAGAGSFVGGGHWGSVGMRALGVADLDLDGDLDIVGSSPTGIASIAWNSGSAVFSPGPVLSGSPASDGCALGDFDRDGDIDIVQGGSRVWTNTARQIAPEGIPWSGGRVLVRVYGAPLAPWRLFAAPARADALVPPFGRLLIDPLTAFEAAAGTLGPGGEGGAAFAIPADPAFVGLTAWWQAFFPLDRRFSNAVATTVLDG